MSEFIGEVIPPGNGKGDRRAVTRWRFFISFFIVTLIAGELALFGYISGNLPGWNGFLPRDDYQMSKFELDTVYGFYLETRINNARQLQCEAVIAGNRASMTSSYQALQRWVSEFYRHEGYAYAVPLCTDLIPSLEQPLGASAPVPPPQPMPSPIRR